MLSAIHRTRGLSHGRHRGMNLAFRLKMAKQKAAAFLRENGYSALPIDPFAIAEKLDIVVQPKSDTADGVSGMLLRHGNNFGITRRATAMKASKDSAWPTKSPISF